ncbi:putative hydro-lyase [Lentilactobacillus sp. TOM.63]|uniref:putative hydro-lyase n=1 Tax=Lentilactobacillus sp. TOM.63 TaxID=3055077 RepID=UPI0025A06D9C|nr:putative hydro-lyase [Lentilactobacillus sp. TOM.63]MDM7517176.1 putative hydro-lyase [Lentilactobacillus sp. TOM.63]
MTTDMTTLSPVELRHLIRSGDFFGQTSGLCPGYTQANLAILPKDLAYDFLLFTQRNPRPCPVLEVSDTGSRKLHEFADDIDLANDFPKYRIYRNGKVDAEVTSVADIWQNDFVSFIIGCSFSFESELLASGIEVRNITEKVNVPMFNTNIPLKSADPFHGNMVVSMRPIPETQIPTAVQVTGAMPNVHGAPIQIGDPETIGISDLAHPDYGDPVTIKAGEQPVFWPCGVTPQNVIMQTKPPLVITHAPGHMLVTDVVNATLKY